MKTLALALCCLIACQSVSAQTQIEWTRTNPGGGGAFSTMKAGPSGIIIAGSDLSGAYRSQDNGVSWDVIGASRGVTQTHISGIGFDPNDGNVIFLGTTRGIFRSIDRGDSFTNPLNNGYVTDIAIARANSSIVYAAYHGKWNNTVSSIYRSTNGGTSFSKVSNSTIDGLRIIKVLVDPTDPNTLYIVSGQGRGACSDARLYRSTDGANTWTRLGSNLGKILGFDIDPANTSTMYVTTMNADCSAQYYYTDRLGSFYTSTDQGNSWTKTSDRTGVVIVKKDNPNIIRRIDPRNTADWNSESGTWESTDSGVTWTKTGIVTKLGIGTRKK